MHEVPRGTVGHLAVRGPTGCRYLNDPRQRDLRPRRLEPHRRPLLEDEDGDFHFVARADDIIVSGGEAIAAPEVEAALLSHSSVSDCAVVGIPDKERGEVVKAFIVLAPNEAGSALAVKRLQDHVKATIAPHKYPRSVIFVDALPPSPAAAPASASTCATASCWR